MAKSRNFRSRFYLLIEALRSNFRLHGIYTATIVLISKTPIIGNIFALLFHRKFLVPVKIVGTYPMYVNVFDPGISWQLLTRGTREEAHVAQIQHALKSGENGIELGANIGFFTLIEAPLIAPKGRIWCIEPVLSNIRLLTRNVATNHLQEYVHVSRYLIGERDGEGRIELASASNSHMISKQHLTGNFETIPMIALDTFMRTRGIKPQDVQFLRMDIEGYEVMALQGMRKLMESKTPLKFFIELHPQAYQEWGWTLERFLRELEKYGFRIRKIAKERERGSDGAETTILLDEPTIDELLDIQKNWRPGGIQAYLERT